MIEKERIEKLAEENATLYYIDENSKSIWSFGISLMGNGIDFELTEAELNLFNKCYETLDEAKEVADKLFKHKCKAHIWVECQPKEDINEKETN